MNLSVNGLGMVSRLGDQDNLKELFANSNPIDPRSMPLNHTLPIDIPADLNIAQQLLRRMSHFSKISLLSAGKAIKDSGFNLTGKAVGIIQGSVYGPIISGLQAFDDLIDFGDNQLSPTNFSGSVFNTSATYLSLSYGIQGPTLSHTCGMDTLYHSLLTASIWLESGAVDYVLVGIGDEYTSYFDDGFLSGAPHFRSTPGLLPDCEGWTTFLVSRDETAKYGRIECGYLKSLPQTRDQKIIYSVWHEQRTPASFLNHASKNQACFPGFLRGFYPSAAAFDLAVALICVNTGRFPMVDGSEGHYRIQKMDDHEKIRCYSISENGNLFYYETPYDDKEYLISEKSGESC